MSASLKSLSIFVDSRSNINFEDNVIFQEMKLGTSVIHHFVFLTGQSISDYLGSSSRSKGQFQVKYEKL